MLVEQLAKRSGQEPDFSSSVMERRQATPHTFLARNRVQGRHQLCSQKGADLLVQCLMPKPTALPVLFHFTPSRTSLNHNITHCCSVNSCALGLVTSNTLVLCSVPLFFPSVCEGGALDNTSLSQNWCQNKCFHRKLSRLGTAMQSTPGSRKDKSASLHCSFLTKWAGEPCVLTTLGCVLQQNDVKL